jgi:hypothetical protein
VAAGFDKGMPRVFQYEQGLIREDFFAFSRLYSVRISIFTRIVFVPVESGGIADRRGIHIKVYFYDIQASRRNFEGGMCAVGFSPDSFDGGGAKHPPAGPISEGSRWVSPSNLRGIVRKGPNLPFAEPWADRSPLEASMRLADRAQLARRTKLLTKPGWF